MARVAHALLQPLDLVETPALLPRWADTPSKLVFQKTPHGSLRNFDIGLTILPILSQIRALRSHTM